MKNNLKLIFFGIAFMLGSRISMAQNVNPECSYCKNFDFAVPDTLCINKPIVFINRSGNCAPLTPTFKWNFGDGSPVTTNPSHIYTTPGTYNVTLSADYPPNCRRQDTTKRITVLSCSPFPPPPPCIDCIGSFAPETGIYILSAWVKEAGALPNRVTYTYPQIFIQFPASPGASTPPPIGPFTATGAIIDGWQRIESEFTIPPGAVYINIQLNSASGDCYFDDIRIFPINGSMKSYVYDPVNLRLVAELDERNYATIYNYDEEGKLVRVKKETEKGIMSIKENKNFSKQKQ